MALGFVHCGTFFLFAAFALLLIATISAPVIHQVSFLDVTGGGGGRSTFGTFGYCANIDAANSGCTSASVGYDVPLASISVFGREWNNNAFDRLSNALILHPIACGITFLALLVSACSDRLGYIFASLLALLAFIVSLVVMIIDFVMFGIIKREVNNETTRTANYGNAIWMVLAATVVLFFSVFIVLFSCCTARKNRRRGDNKAYETGGYVGNGPQMGYAQPRRTWYGRTKY